MGGTLRFISNEPDLAAFGGEFIGGYSTVDSGGDGWNGTAVLNAPVVKDVFGLRIAGEVREEPGYIDNIQLGTRNINDRKLKQLRARARWQASENVTVDATYYHYDNEAGAPNLVDDLETLTVSTYADVEPYSEVDAFNATINADLGFATLVSATSYSDRLQSQPSASGDGVNSLIFVDAEIGGDDFTQELRLHSNNDGPLQWTAGAYYTSTEGDQPIHISVISVIPGGGALLGIPGTDLKVAADSVNSITNDVSSWALFGEVSYDFTERLTATFGARYYQSEYDWTNDSINTVTTSVLLNGLPLFEFPSVTQESNAPSGDDDSFSPRFNLSYAFAEDTMGYFNVAKGFRAGGVNLILNVPVPGGGFVQLPENYDPETLWTYEVGAKSLLDDGRWMLEGAAYYTDWTDLQAIFLPFEGASIGGTKNQGAATVYGAEVAASFLPVPTVALTGNVAYADATFDDATADHDKGDPVPYVPEFTFTAAMDWRPDFGGGIKGLVHIDYSYQDEINRINNSGVYKISTSDSFNFLNLRLGIEKDSWGAYLVGRNLTDDQGAANPVSPEQTTTFVPVRPRMLGAEFRIRF
jgi:outer membrane receptor protein involved in Fe transport